MLKFNKVLLASDFDNTLVYTQGALERGEDIPPMSARNREAVEYFIQNGGYFSISTGRALPAFARYAKDLPCNAPCVIANGAAIYDFNKDCYVETAFLDADIYDHVDALLARFPGLCFVDLPRRPPHSCPAPERLHAQPRAPDAREDPGGQGLPRGGPADHQAAL